MSIATYTDWEIRTTGAATNGGGFKDLNPGTSVDYSQQVSAQLALTDIATDGAGTGVSSTTGGFTAAMEGNVIFLAGSGVTTGWYQITGYTDTNNITIDRSAGASASGITGNVGGAWKFDSTYFNTFFSTANKTSYNEVHIAAGTYSGSFGSTVLTMAAAYNRWIGYNTTREDGPTGTNRPLLSLGSAGAYINWTGSYGRLSDCQIDMAYTGGTTIGIVTGSFLTVRNCKITRSGYTGAYGIQIGDYGLIYQCEVICTAGTAIRLSDSQNVTIQWSYIHDSTNGVLFSGSGSHSCTVESCIIDSCSGIGAQFYTSARITNCTVYNCGTGLYPTQWYSSVVNCVVHSCTTGINGPDMTYDDNNIVYNCTTPWTGGIVAGPNSSTSDPLLADPANQDFTYDATSPAFNTGIKLGAAVGLP